MEPASTPLAVLGPLSQCIQEEGDGCWSHDMYVPFLGSTEGGHASVENNISKYVQRIQICSWLKEEGHLVDHSASDPYRSAPIHHVGNSISSSWGKGSGVILVSDMDNGCPRSANLPTQIVHYCRSITNTYKLLITSFKLCAGLAKISLSQQCVLWFIVRITVLCSAVLCYLLESVHLRALKLVDSC